MNSISIFSADIIKPFIIGMQPPPAIPGVINNFGTGMEILSSKWRRDGQIPVWN